MLYSRGVKLIWFSGLYEWYEVGPHTPFLFLSPSPSIPDLVAASS